jgi:hypothetical protein
VNESRDITASFVRGFFLSLERDGHRAAVLHGGEGGFEGEISDVDFVVDHNTFPDLPRLIRAYCSANGWLLCQILRHETTAAYFVCSDGKDPSRSVALDACSDYQRNGTPFLSVGELLESRRILPWGGHGLAPSMELRYRFAKAAAKHKDSNTAASEFAAYPEEARKECEIWLAERWGIHLQSWDAGSVSEALALIRNKSNSRPSLMQGGALGRILSRILRPTGVIVVASDGDLTVNATALEGVFGNLHFRRFRNAEKWQVGMLKDLVSSTLIVLPGLSPCWQKILPTDCVHVLDPATPAIELAGWLQQRCERRETT